MGLTTKHDLKLTPPNYGQVRLNGYNIRWDINTNPLRVIENFKKVKVVWTGGTAC